MNEWADFLRDSLMQMRERLQAAQAQMENVMKDPTARAMYEQTAAAMNNQEVQRRMASLKVRYCRITPPDKICRRTRRLLSGRISLSIVSIKWWIIRRERHYNHSACTPAAAHAYTRSQGPTRADARTHAGGRS